MTKKAKKRALGLLRNWDVEYNYENGEFSFEAMELNVLTPSKLTTYTLKQIAKDRIATFVGDGMRNDFTV